MFSSLLHKSDSCGIMPTSNNGSKLRMQPWEAQKIVDLRTIGRSFIFDILLAYSCRELGAVLISGNEQDLNRIRRVFSFQSTAPYPKTI